MGTASSDQGSLQETVDDEAAPRRAPPRRREIRADGGGPWSPPSSPTGEDPSTPERGDASTAGRPEGSAWRRRRAASADDGAQEEDQWQVADDIAGVQQQIAAMEAELRQLRGAPPAAGFGADPDLGPRLAAAAQATARAEEARQLVAAARPEAELVKEQLAIAVKVAAQLDAWFVENAAKLHIKDLRSTPSAYVLHVLEACAEQSAALSLDCLQVEGRLEASLAQSAARHAEALQQAMAAQQQQQQHATAAQQQQQAAQAVQAAAAAAQQGPLLYEGALSHPAFGAQLIEIRVQLDTASGGRWFAVGQSQQIEVVSLGGDRIVLREVAAGSTQLDGVRDGGTGAIQGEVVRSGVRGGWFRLMPVHDPQRRAQLFRQIYGGAQQAAVTAPPMAQYMRQGPPCGLTGFPQPPPMPQLSAVGSQMVLTAPKLPVAISRDGYARVVGLPSHGMLQPGAPHRSVLLPAPPPPVAQSAPEGAPLAPPA